MTRNEAELNLLRYLIDADAPEVIKESLKKILNEIDNANEKVKSKCDNCYLHKANLNATYVNI